MVNLNGGNLKAQHDATYNNTLTVSGSSGLTVNAATQFSNVTLAAAGSLNMNGGTLGIAAAGSLTLGASGTITGNLPLGNSSLLNFSALPASGASLLNVTGTLTVNSELLLGQGTIDGVAWTEGSYDLISAGTVTGVPASSFVLGDNLLGSWLCLNGRGATESGPPLLPPLPRGRTTAFTMIIPESSWETLAAAPRRR